jgi:hypothetical protein
MPKKTSKPGEIHLRIIEVLKRFPEGMRVKGRALAIPARLV